MSIEKHVNGLKVLEVTVRTSMKQVSSQDLNALDYAICGVLENKINATSQPNIGLPKIAIQEVNNWISE